MEFPQPRVVIEDCAIATMDGGQHDDTGAEHRSGHIVISGGRITAVGEDPAPASAAAGARRVDGTGCLATPGLINTHHHRTRSSRTPTTRSPRRPRQSAGSTIPPPAPGSGTSTALRR